MRSLISTIAILLGTTMGAFAQVTATTSAFDIGGIKVIYKPSPKKVMDIRVYYRGGIANFPASKACLEYFTLNAAVQCGSKNYGANAQKDTCDKYGIGLSGGSNFDYGYIELNCISKYFDKGWDVFADAVLAPAFQKRDVEFMRTKIIANNHATEVNPIAATAKQLVLSAYSGTAHGFDPYGNDETINAIGDTDLRKYYYSTLLNKERMFIVAVGNFTKDELKEKIFQSFDNIPSRPYHKPAYEQPELNTNKLVQTQRSVPINYVAAIANAPLIKSPDFIPFKLGVAALGGNLYWGLVTNSHLANAIAANCVQTQMPYAYFSFTTNKPKETIAQALSIIRDTKQKGLNDEWLMRIKNSFVIGNFMNQQNVAAITNNLGEAEVYSNWQYGDDFTPLVYMTTPQQVTDALNKYITGFSWSYLGDPNAVKDYQIPPLD